jgi:competence protein ComEA
MEIKEIAAQVTPFVKRYWLPLSLATLGLIFFAYGLISLFVNKSQPQTSFSQDNSTKSVASETPSVITIDIEGSVVAPGIYKLPINSIVQDALIAAKGLSEDADRNYVAKNINLAEKLSDSQKIYVPQLSEQTNQNQGIGTNTDTTVVSQDMQSDLININTASAVDLDSLPGIGPVTAQKIITNRPYSVVDDLLNNKIVSNKVFTEIKDKITAY